MGKEKIKATEYRLTRDVYSWMIVKPKTRKDGVIEWRGFKWFPKIEQALSWLYDELLAEAFDEDAKSIDEIRQILHAERSYFLQTAAISFLTDPKSNKGKSHASKPEREAA